MTDDDRLAQIQARDADRARGGETGVTMTQSQADVGFLLRRLESAEAERDEARGELLARADAACRDDSDVELDEARELANVMYEILRQQPVSPGDYDARLDRGNKPGWLVGEQIRSRP